MKAQKQFSFKILPYNKFHGKIVQKTAEIYVDKKCILYECNRKKPIRLKHDRVKFCKNLIINYGQKQ